MIHSGQHGIEPYLIGGGGFTDALAGVLNDEGYLLGYGQALEADDNFGIVVDATGYAVELSAGSTWDGKSPARAVYIMGTSPFGPADLITR